MYQIQFKTSYGRDSPIYGHLPSQANVSSREFTYSVPKLHGGANRILRAKISQCIARRADGPIIGFAHTNAAAPIVYRDPWSGVSKSTRTGAIACCCFSLTTLCCTQTCAGENPRFPQSSKSGRICSCIQSLCYLPKCFITVSTLCLFKCCFCGCIETHIASNTYPDCCYDPNCKTWFVES